MKAERRKRRWCFMDLVVDHQTGKLRETLVWSNLFKGVLLWAVWKYINGTNFLEVAGIAGAIYLAHEGFSRVMNQKQQKIEIEKESLPTKDKP